jgi:hypothetical protein
MLGKVVFFTQIIRKEHGDGGLNYTQIVQAACTRPLAD